jgi:uncharacterized protein YlxW (UPF0749 family)
MTKKRRSQKRPTRNDVQQLQRQIKDLQASMAAFRSEITNRVDGYVQGRMQTFFDLLVGGLMVDMDRLRALVVEQTRKPQ